MKNLYRIFAACFFFFLFIQANSQITGIRAGLNLSSIKYSAEGDSETMDTKPGFQIGPVAEFSISNNFAFETGLLLSIKGGQESSNGNKDVLSLVYLEIPANFKAYVPAGNLRLYGMAGPFLGIGISGKDKYSYEGETESTSIEFGSGQDSDIKRMDFGLSVGAGIEIKSIQAGISYGMGLANLSNDNGWKLKNNLLAVTIAVHLGGK